MKQQENFDDWKVVIPSRLEKIEKVIDLIKLDADKTGFTSNRFTELQLVLHEAISNAIKHGNKFDENKKVKVGWKREDSGLRVIIKDEGNGFNHAELPNPLAPENLMKDSGRGIHFIKQIAQEVRFNEKGSRITFLFTK